MDNSNSDESSSESSSEEASSKESKVDETDGGLNTGGGSLGSNSNENLGNKSHNGELEEDGTGDNMFCRFWNLCRIIKNDIKWIYYVIKSL